MAFATSSYKLLIASALAPRSECPGGALLLDMLAGMMRRREGATWLSAVGAPDAFGAVFYDHRGEPLSGSGFPIFLAIFLRQRMAQTR